MKHPFHAPFAQILTMFLRILENTKERYIKYMLRKSKWMINFHCVYYQIKTASNIVVVFLCFDNNRTTLT